MLNDPIAAALTKMKNAENIGKKEVVISSVSNLLRKILKILQEEHYIGAFEEIEGVASPTVRVNLLGNINKCGAIKPRFSIKSTTYEKWEKRYLPAKDFGVLIVSTPQGLLTHMQSKEKNIGGKLIAYCY